MDLNKKKENSPNLSDPAYQRAFLQDTSNNLELLQKELMINKEEQRLLKKRIELMKQLMSDLPTSDPQHSMVATTLHMDQIELDELSIRADYLLKKIGEL